MRRLSYHSKRFLARVHFWILGFSLFGYLALTFTLGPGFLSFDVGEKIRALADEIIVVTAVVLGPPATPVVTATPTCVSGNPRIVLDWADDAATSTWDIERDSAPLVSGLTSSNYTDTAVTGTVTYEYVVTAYGPMSPGTATSLPVSATAIDCSTLLPDPEVTITTIASTNVVPPRAAVIKVSGEHPRVTGTTNIENAIVDIAINRPTIIARVVANSNGYFTWKPPRTLQSGNHYLTVTVTDPNDNSRVATDSLSFFLRETEVEEDDEDTEDEVITSLPTDSFFDPSFDFSLSIKNTEAILQQGEKLTFSITPTRGLFPPETVFETVFLDKYGKEIFTPPNYKVKPENRPGFDRTITVPLYIPEATYLLQVTATFGETTITRSVPFTVIALPVLYMGSNEIITYAEIASFIGWILFSAISIFASFFLLLLREYWLYLHGIRIITERELWRLGAIALRKGVGK